jgi:hypothetical protein
MTQEYNLKLLGSKRRPHASISYENGKYFKFAIDLCWVNFPGTGTLKQSYSVLEHCTE